MEHKGGPTVILARTVKGYGMGTSQARNVTHNEKKLTDEGLAAFVKQFDIPIPEQAAEAGSFYRPAGDSPELMDMPSRRKELGGYLPKLHGKKPEFTAPALSTFVEGIRGWDTC